MLAYRFKNVCLESYALELPPEEVTSAALEDRLAPIYKKLGIPFGTLEKLSGVKTRYFWPKTVMPSEPATSVARKALEKAGLTVSDIGALFSCSVTRDYFEPATAALIHGRLGLPEQSVSMDISNACLGFSNGLITLANLIESGVVKAGIVVSGENVNGIIESTLAKLNASSTLSREELLKLVPTFTLGCGAAAFVLTHQSISKSKHRIIGSVTRCATQFNDLCVGNADYCMSDLANLDPIMETDSQKIISSAASLGGRAWKDFSEAHEWKRDDVQHIFCHQVGKQVNSAFYQEMGLDMSKEYTVYPRYGNLVSAALPSCFITKAEKEGFNSGDKILFTAFGSGLNTVFTGIVW